MTIKQEAKIEEEMTCRFKFDKEFNKLKIIAKFEGKLTSASKNDKRNFLNLYLLK